VVLPFGATQGPLVAYETEMKAVRTLRNLFLARRALRSTVLPVSAKVLLIAALLYGILPVDLVPDFIPVLGLLDDLLVIGTLLVAALRKIVRAPARMPIRRSSR